jgi:GxxExxY protein
MKATDPALRAHFPLPEVTRAILGSFFKVYNSLGHGFLERVYVRALAKELRERGLDVALEVPLDVFYEDALVGTYRADCIVERGVIVEVKTRDRLHPAHEAQLLHYLRSTSIEVGMSLNFGERAEFKRLAFSNRRKSLR